MMAKIVKGSDFKGVVDYIIDKKKDTQIVASEGLFMENLETIAMSFNAQSRMNDKVTKPVGHIALSFSKEDELRLTNRIMAGIALEYMERMGIKNTQFFIAQHFILNADEQRLIEDVTEYLDRIAQKGLEKERTIDSLRRENRESKELRELLRDPEIPDLP